MGAFEWYSPDGEYLSRQAASLPSNFLVKCQKEHIPARVGWVRSWGSAVEHSTFSGPAERTWFHEHFMTCRLVACVLCAMHERAVHTRLFSSRTLLACPRGGAFSSPDNLIFGATLNVPSWLVLAPIVESLDLLVACPLAPHEALKALLYARC